MSNDNTKEKFKLKTLKLKPNKKSNFRKKNSIMNNRFIAYADYKKMMTRDLSNYDEYFQIKKQKKNLKYCFNGKYLPKSISSYKSPFDLLHEKTILLKNMITFSQDMHNISEIEKESKKQNPKIKSFAINKNNTKYSSFLQIRNKNDTLYLSDNLSNKINNNLLNFNAQNDKKLIYSYKVHYRENYSTDINNINKKIIKAIKLNTNNYNNHTNLYNNNENNRYLLSIIPKINFKANCYYNKLHLLKLTNLLTKNTYLDKDN